MILGIGVDIVHLPRIAALISRRGKERLARRILSSSELAEFETRFPTLISVDQQQQQLRYLGSRWCIKEAVYKALYPSHRLEWKQVTVIKKFGKPELDIASSQLLGIHKAHVSLSHDGEYAIAQVVLEAKVRT